MGDAEGDDVAMTGPAAQPPDARTGGRGLNVWALLALGVLVVACGLVVAWVRGPAVSDASPTPTAAATAIPSPTPTPTTTPTWYAANTAAYDVAALPQVNVFAVNSALPVDDAPFAAPLPEHATARGSGAPVWADPAGPPIAYLPRDFPHGGTSVPVIEEQAHWVRVLLTGRQAVPSQGDPRQTTGWLRRSDIDLAPTDALVVVSISARTVDIVRAGAAERVASDFAWGADLTPTPLGRAFIMTTAVVPEFAYTRGHPIVYLSVQSPTLDGFGGAGVAVTAFHYHDHRSGPISNGCLRVDPAAIARLAELPLGTPVIVNP